MIKFFTHVIITILLSNFSNEILSLEIDDSDNYSIETCLQSINNSNLSLDDYYFDLNYQSVENFNNIINEFLSASENNTVYFGDTSSNNSLEKIGCNYTTFKNVIVNSSKTNAEKYNIIKNTRKYTFDELEEYYNNAAGPLTSPDVGFEDDDPGTNITSPQITVNIFTAGAGGSAIDWSNNGENYSSSEEFYLNENSLPYKIATKYNTNVIIANVNSNNQWNLKKIELSKSNELYGYDDAEFEDLDALNNNDVIIFNFDDNLYSNEYVYQKFLGMISSIFSYHVNTKFNLIGHSRGGLINAMYAADYGYNVNKIYSIGTPYYENDIAEITNVVENMSLYSNNSDFTNFVNGFGVGSDCYDDLADENVAKNIRIGLNNSIVNNNLDVTAIGVKTNIIVPISINWYNVFLTTFVELCFATDGLVDSYKAVGKDSSCTNISLFSSYIYYKIIENENSEDSLSGINREVITFRGYDLLSEQFEYMVNEKNDSFAQIGSPYAIPHNLETMYPKIHNIILEDL